VGGSGAVVKTSIRIIDELHGLGQIRAGIYRDIEVVNRDLGKLLAEAKAHPDVEMSKAALAAGISRPLAYKLVRKSCRPDAE
jgi:hypothetical protein